MNFHEYKDVIVKLIYSHLYSALLNLLNFIAYKPLYLY